MTKKKMTTTNSRQINQDVAVFAAKGILEAMDGLPMELFLSVLNGIMIAVATLVRDVREKVELSDEDGLEKVMLNWLSLTDDKTGNNFAKYIRTELITNRGKDNDGNEQAAS